jgi:hypothetical protein
MEKTVMSKIKSPKAAKKPKVINERKPDKAARKRERAAAKRRKALNKKLDRTINVMAVVLALISGGLDVVAKIIDNKRKNK